MHTMSAIMLNLHILTHYSTNASYINVTVVNATTYNLALYVNNHQPQKIVYVVLVLSTRECHTAV